MSKNVSRNVKNLAYDRIQRVSDLMHRNIARLLASEFKDPRVGMVTVAGVEVSRDLAHAKVFVTVFEEDKSKETIAILNKATGFFRMSLAQVTDLRIIPKIRFHFDESVAQGARIESLLRQCQ
jgi:ribosome-binding factor A